MMTDSRTNQFRKRKNQLALLLLGLSALIILIPLLCISFYVIAHGLPALHLRYFTELPKPVGETGGGMANAILGTLPLLSLASGIGVPWGIALALYLSEYGNGKTSPWVRF